jgi:hypothetical protein
LKKKHNGALRDGEKLSNVSGARLELLAISGVGSVRLANIHPGEHPIQRRNLRKQFLVLGTLKLQRQLINAPLDLCTRKFFRQDEVDRHPRCISQHRTEGQ